MSADTATFVNQLGDRTSWRADRCPAGKAMEIVGTRSAILIMREAYFGTTRFEEFAERVGMTEGVAAARLRELTDAGLLERHPYREDGQRTRHRVPADPDGARPLARRAGAVSVGGEVSGAGRETTGRPHARGVRRGHPDRGDLYRRSRRAAERSGRFAALAALNRRAGRDLAAVGSCR